MDLHGAGTASRVIAAPESTSIYVASSNSFQASNLLSVRRLDQLLTGLRNSGSGSETFTIKFRRKP
jgi:hypothetical protein